MNADAALLEEVESFLTECEDAVLPSINLQSLHDGQQTEIPTPHLVNARGRRRLPSSGDAKREKEKAQDRRRRALYRVRRQEERCNLLQQVKDLSAELTARQKLKHTKVPMSTTAWKLLAQRLQQERKHAEDQQRRLWAEIDARSTLLKDLYLRLACDNNTSSSNALCQRKRMRFGYSDEKMYEVYLQELDEVFNKTDQVFHTFAENDCNDDGQWREDDAGAFIYTAKMVVATDFQQACNALWDASKLPHCQNDRQRYDEVENGENTAAFKFRLTTRSSSRVVSVVQHSATRKYQEDGRLVIVWRSFLQGEGEFAGMHADETGWDELTPSEDGTMMKTYIHHVPMHVGAAVAKEPVMKEFNDVVLDSVSDIGEDIYQRFEQLRITEV